MKVAFNYIFGILLLLSLILNGILVYKLKTPSEPAVIRVTDTVVIKQDSIIEKTKFITKKDTVVQFIRINDTDTIHDTLTVSIPVEHKTSEFTIQKDSLTINETIHHSGWNSRIDSIDIAYSWNYTLPKVKQKKIGLVWNVGLYAGYGINFNNGQYYFSPEVGVGASIGIGGIIK